MAELHGEQRARAAHAEAEKRFDVVFETTPAPSVIVRLANAEPVAVNEGFLEVLGYDRAALLKKSFYDIQPYESASAFEKVLKELRRGEAVKQTEMDLRAKSGTQKRVIMSAKPLELDNQACAIFTFSDITELREVQKQLEKARLRLAQMRERDRLSLARELHDDAVQGLIGLSYRLAQESKAAKTCETCGTDLSETFKGYQQDVLAVSRQLRGVIRGLRPAGLVEFGLSAAIKNYVEDFGEEGRGKVPEIRLELQKSNPYLPQGDKTAQQLALCLFRATQETLRNAATHARATKVSIHLLFDEEKDEVTLRVQDNGQGFEVPASFGGLAQEDHFGLIGTDEYVSALGGHLEVDSKPGQGTTVTVRLPLSGPRYKLPGTLLQG